MPQTAILESPDEVEIDIVERIRLRTREVFGPFAGDSVLMTEAAIEIGELRGALTALLEAVRTNNPGGKPKSADQIYAEAGAHAVAALTTYGGAL
jgi:hypothetical protein